MLTPDNRTTAERPEQKPEIEKSDQSLLHRYLNGEGQSQFQDHLTLGLPIKPHQDEMMRASKYRASKAIQAVDEALGKTVGHIDLDVQQLKIFKDLNAIMSKV